MPEMIVDPGAMRERSRAARRGGLTVGLVPTMGYLHEGHMSLFAGARAACGLAVVSIFVNPTQFGPAEDFERYPRDLDRDRTMVERAEADVLFLPETETIYPDGSTGQRTWVTVEGMSDVLCGRSRPGHFRGVTTVVTKLLNIVEPDAVWFGQKDAQQAIVIRRMARDLDMAARIEVGPTVRERDGLAMSSRNAYLSPRGRAAAPIIHRALAAARQAASDGERSAPALLALTRAVLARERMFEIDYVELVSTDDLRPIAGELSGPALLAVAGRIEKTRLIDNELIHGDDQNA